MPGAGESVTGERVTGDFITEDTEGTEESIDCDKPCMNAMPALLRALRDLRVLRD